MFTWLIAAGAAGLLGAGIAYLYINWTDIKDWAINQFQRLKERVRKAFAKLMWRAGKLIEKLYYAEEGKFYVVEGQPREITQAQLQEEVNQGNLKQSEADELINSSLTTGELNR